MKTQQAEVEAYAWRVIRELLAGIGWGLLGFFLVPLAIFPPFVDWLRTSAMGEVSPAHDLLTGELRSYWGVVLVYGVGTALQVRVMVRTVVRFFQIRPEEKALEDRLEDEFISLTYLSGPGPDRRRAELKKLLDQLSAALIGRFMGLFMVIALAVMVLVWYGTVLFTGGAASAPIAPQKYIPALLAELEQLEEGELEQAEVWIHPQTDTAHLPGAWGSGYRAYAHRYHIVETEPGSQWVEVLVPDALDVSPNMERPFRESQSSLWNLEHAQRYRVRYTSKLHLVTEILPVP